MNISRHSVLARRDGRGANPVFWRPRWPAMLAVLLINGGLALQAAVPTEGLRLRLEAGAVTGLVDGAALSLWRDGSGRGLDVSQANASMQPHWQAVAFHGRPAVQFDGNDRLDRGSVPGASLGTPTNATLFLVIKPSAADTMNTSFSWGSGTSRYYLHSTADAWIHFQQGDPALGAGWPEPAGWDDAWHAVLIRRAGPRLDLLYDGVWQSPRPMGGSLPTNLVQTLYIGSDAYNNYQTGCLHALLVYDRALDDAACLELMRSFAPITLHVDAASAAPSAPYTTWSTAAATIQDAADAARDGDTILVRAGTYGIGGATAPGATLLNRVCLTNAVTVRSVDGPSATVIDASGAVPARGAYLGGGARLEGFTLAGGRTEASGGVPDTAGGGACVVSGTVARCVARGNSAVDGGGLHLEPGGAAENCLLVSNTAAGSGGGARLAAGARLDFCTVADNAAGDAGGGVVLADGGTLRNTIVYGNQAVTGDNWSGTNGVCDTVCTTPTNTLPGASGCFDDDPAFLSGHRLPAASPCVDAATEPAGCTADLDGAPRSRDGDGDGVAAPDLGCFERAARQPFVVVEDENAQFYAADWNPASNAFVRFRFLGHWRKNEGISAYTRGTAIADVNGDGHDDIIVSRAMMYQSCGYGVFLNDGTNGFTRQPAAAVNVQSEWWCMDMAAGDFNNDGFADFIAQGDTGSVTVFLGDGRGGFRAAIQDGLEWRSRGLDAADFDRDGNLDLVRAAYSSGNLRVYPGNGDGTFSAYRQIMDLGSDPYGVTAGDFNGDGLDDIIANSDSSGTVYFFRGLGNGTFAAAVTVPRLDFDNLGAFDAYDYDGDGDLDIVACNYSGRTLFFCRGDNTGTNFAAAATVGTTPNYLFGIAAPIPPPSAGRPAVSLLPGAQTVAAGAAATLDGSGTTGGAGSILSNAWDFGEGGAVVAEAGAPGATSRVYAAEGLYRARLRVTDSATNTAWGAATVAVTGAVPVVAGGIWTYGEADAVSGVWPVTLEGSAFASDAEGLAGCDWVLRAPEVQDFETDDLSRWIVFAGSWATTDALPIAGARSMRQSNTVLGRARALFDQEVSGDFVLEADFQWRSGSGQECIFVLCAGGMGDGYEAIIRGRGYNDLRLDRAGTILSNVELGYVPAAYQVHHFKAERRGNWLHLSIDGRLLLSYNDPYGMAGRCGFTPYQTEMVVDNFSLRLLRESARTPEAPFADDFEDGTADGWSSWEGSWAVTATDPLSGSYSLHQSNASASRARFMHRRILPSAAAAGADVRLLSGSGQEFHLHLGVRSDNSRLECIFRGRGLNDALFIRRVDGAEISSASLPLPFAIGLNTTYQIRVQRLYDKLTFWIGTNALVRIGTVSVADGIGDGLFGLCTYQTAARFDNVWVEPLGRLTRLDHTFSAGTNLVGLVAYDAAGQAATGTVTLVMQRGEAPTALAGGPYAVDEITGNADANTWLVSLDGSGSSDPTTSAAGLRCDWDLGTDTFDGAVLTTGKWVTSSTGVAGGGTLAITGNSNWGQRYAFTRHTIVRSEGVAFEARILPPSSGNAMVGLKNSNTTYSYNQMPYAFYFHDNAAVNIYENGSDRGQVFAYTPGQWYEMRIELKAAAGARYYLRPAGVARWWLCYDSSNATDTQFRRGMDVYSGTFQLDDLRDLAHGVSPDWRFHGAGAHTATLVVTDPSGMADTNSAAVTVQAGDPPVADAGADQTQAESNAVDRVWTFAFNAGGSSDDHGIYSYEWDWDYDGVAFQPSGDTLVAPTHAWTEPGVYTAAVRVTDHALQTAVDTCVVTVVGGTAPVVDAGGPYTVDEFPCAYSAGASNGAWTVTLDGTGSGDADSSVVQYVWTVGEEAFATNAWLDEKWIRSSDATVTNGVLTFRWLGANSDSGHYCFTRDTFARVRGLRAETRIRFPVASVQILFGFKNDDASSSHWNQWVYALHNHNGMLYSVEGGSEASLGVAITANVWYDWRIELKSGGGARYYYKPADAAEWILLRDSTYSSAARFRRGYHNYYGSFEADHYGEYAAGSAPAYRVYTGGTNAVSLTVWDQALQTNAVATTLLCLTNAPPVADAGVDHYGTETNCTEGIWWFTFSAVGSSDDHGLYRYEWDWDYDGTFAPSGDTGATVMHPFSIAAIGTNTIAVRVTDHVLQQAVDTARVILGVSGPPAAEAGGDLTVEAGWPLTFNGGVSTDDVAVARYAWDFGDGATGVGHSPQHIYRTPTNYLVTLVVYDAVEQASAPDTLTVTVVTSTPPTAVAGGPYYAGAGGPPAYFDARNSTDNADTNVVQGIAQYLWDRDIYNDSDANGHADDDVDLLGPTPFHAYPTVGIYTSKLTVVDAVSQTNTDTAIVFVDANRAPHVICVPLHGDPSSPHLTYTGHVARLKAIVRDAGTLTCQWDFGDGSSSTVATVANKYAIEATHAYAGPVGRPFTARLRVWDAAGLTGQDEYPLVIRPDTLDTRANIAVDEGLWNLHKAQDKSAGYWKRPYGGYYASAGASALQALQINGHRIDGDPREDPYVETVRLGFHDLFGRLTTWSIGAQTYGDPDSNRNGIGIGVNGGYTGYESGMVMDAIASSRALLAMASSGPARVKHRFFFDILTDMVDQYAWGQQDSGAGRGGWRYSWNYGSSDNSACQWGAIGMLAAQDIFGISIPAFVRRENQIWLAYSYNPAGYFGYDDNVPEWNWYSVSPSAMVQMAVNGTKTTNAIWRATEDYIADRWPIESATSRLYYGQYAFVKAMRLAKPRPVAVLNKSGLDWFYDAAAGLQKLLVGQQAADGSWNGYAQQGGGYGLNYDLSTAWAISMLTPSLFTQPPVAVITAPGLWGYGVPLRFSAANSFHIEAARRITRYEWDFDGDGTYDFTTADPDDAGAVWTYADPHPGEDGDPPAEVMVTLRVTDDNTPAQTAVARHTVTVAEPPHKPYADAGGPYAGVTGVAVVLDGSGSYDIDPTDSVTGYEWDFDADGVPDLATAAAVTSHVFTVAGKRDLALRVWDAGVFNNGTNLVSDWDFTTADIEANLPPAAVPGGPYSVPEDQALVLDGRGSHDPNVLTPVVAFAWDRDGDGLDDAWSSVATQTWFDVSGVVTVRLVVSDGQLAGTNRATVTITPVNDAPSFLKGGHQTVLWNAGPQSVAGWASAITAGPPDEAAQTLGFVAEPLPAGLFLQEPAIAVDGTLTYAPKEWAHGTATVSVVLQDNGGTADGGLDTSAPQVFTIFVNGDTDGDGIHDKWEGIYFPGLGDADGSTDADNDGFLDREEAEADTIPTNKQSLLRIEAFDPAGVAGWRVTWQSVTTRVYHVLRSTTTPEAAAFTVVTSGIPGRVNQTTVTDPEGAHPVRFYRIGTEWPAP